MLEMNVLVTGWTKIPHSYSIVNVFQIVHLYKLGAKLYLYESEYYREEWKDKETMSLYPDEYYSILDKIEVWSGQKVDLVYSISFPYNIDLHFEDVPKCVFYTAEFGKLDVNYFKMSCKIVDDEMIKARVKSPLMYFTCPSIWSSRGMNGYGIEASKNRVITHGVDPDIFTKLDPSLRDAIRDFYRIKQDDVLLCNMGAMTRNKGITVILQALKRLVIDQGLVKYKLLLKGMQDLYSTREFLTLYLKEINAPDTLLDNIIFIDKTMSFSMMNKIYNAIDLYLSPYVAEGFNLIPLEVIATGTKVILPRAGSTVDYSRLLSKYNCITYVDCIHDVNSGCNIYDSDNLVLAIKKSDGQVPDYDGIRNVICNKLSWNLVAKELMDYYKFILENSKIILHP